MSEKSRTNYGNVIPIKEFKGDKSDRELQYLLTYLLTGRHCDNVRTIDKRGWRETSSVPILCSALKVNGSEFSSWLVFATEFRKRAVHSSISSPMIKSRHCPKTKKQWDVLTSTWMVFRICSFEQMMWRAIIIIPGRYGVSRFCRNSLFLLLGDKICC